jgi:hypothetical protein
MATYVPGSEQYLPDIKPFTPDYKFLSAVLDTRQDKYNVNWQATNDVYNKVVYADLMRSDTTDKREQYVNNLAPSLEKIAGMDLSLAQNAQSAKAVFAPFFEDKLIVKDMVKTANYKKQMSYAARLERSPDLDQQDMWWADGVKELQYRMQDFVDMSPEEALDARLYTYTPDADLGKMAQKMLGEMDPPLKMEYDHYAVNKDGSVNGDIIITTTNGEAIVGPALAIIQERLADLPRVQNAYRTQAYVASRNFAANAIKEGAFSTVQEAQQAWATRTIDNIQFNNDREIESGTTELAERRQSTVSWDSYKQSSGVIPGSDEEKLMQQAQSDFDAVSAVLKNKFKIRDIANHNSPDLESTLNKAYSMLQFTNMRTDMIKAAQAYSMRDVKSVIRETDAAKDARQYQYSLMLEEVRNRNKRQLKIDELNGTLINDPILNAMGSPTKNYTEAGAVVFDLDNEKNIYRVSTDQSFEQVNKDRQKQIESIIAYHQSFYSTAGKDAGTMPIDVINKEGEKVVENMTAQELRNYLSIQDTAKDGTNLGYRNVEAINLLYNEFLPLVNDKETTTKLYPLFVNDGNSYVNLKNMFNDTDKLVRSTKLAQITARDIQKNAYDDIKQLLTGSDKANAQALIESGFGDLWTNDENGLNIMLTKEEYVDRAIENAKQGQLKNPDLTGIDSYTGNTPDENYLITQTLGRKNMDVVREVFNSQTPYFVEKGPGLQYTTEDTGIPAVQKIRGNRPIDMPHTMRGISLSEVKEEAEQAYETLHEPMNEALKGNNPEIETATFNSIYQNLDNTTASISNYGVQEAFIDAEVNNPKTDILYATFLNQKNALEAKGTSPIFYITDIEEAQTEGIIAKQVDDGFNANFLSYRTNSGTPSNPAATPRGRIVYGAVYGDLGEKLGYPAAFYTFYPNEQMMAAQVKGGGGDNQFAGLNLQQRNDIKKNGITMVFPQSEDISQGSLKNQAGNVSIIASTINSFGGYWHQSVEVEKAVKGGQYSWQKLDSNNYVLNYELETYIPSKDGVGGNYIPDGNVSQKVNINPSGSIYGGTMSILEIQDNAIRTLLTERGNKNLAAFLKDKAMFNSTVK